MSCLFNSLENTLGITNCRNKICDYIENNLTEIINGLSIKNWIKYSAKDIGINLNEYLQSMRSSNTWGGGPELMIASKMYNIIIIVLNGSKKIEFNSTNNKNSKKIYLNYNGTHYWNIQKYSKYLDTQSHPVSKSSPVNLNNNLRSTRFLPILNTSTINSSEPLPTSNINRSEPLPTSSLISSRLNYSLFNTSNNNFNFNTSIESPFYI